MSLDVTAIFCFGTTWNPTFLEKFIISWLQNSFLIWSLTIQEKAKYHEEQIGSYNEYIKQCLANLQKTGAGKRKRVRFSKSASSGQKSARAAEKTLEYTADRLHEKGVLLSIDGLPRNQYKNTLVSWTCGCLQMCDQIMV